MLRIAAPKGCYDPPPVGAAAALSSLIGELSRVLSELRDVRDSELRGLPPAGPVDAWTDDDFVYIEGHLPDDLGADLDVTVHEGKVFIRLER